MSLTPTSYDGLSRALYDASDVSPAVVVDFTNTHIVSMWNTDPAFREIAGSVDIFVPDSMPLTWAVNAAAGKRVMDDRVYGPTFMRRCLESSPPTVRHYFLGASEDCLQALLAALRRRNSELNIIGSHNGYFADSKRATICAEINTARPDVIWIGLGTPKQQAFAAWLKPRLSQGVVLLVGFAFDVNAGRKKDAPIWMQERGLTWLYRTASEPRRLLSRYLVHNTIFLAITAKWFWMHRNRFRDAT